MTEPARLLVDAAIVKPQLGGLRTYVRSLVGALHDREDVALTIVTSRPDDFRHTPAATIVTCPAATQGFVARAAWREATLARLARSHGADVVLVPYPEMTMRRLPVPSALVVHDVRPVVAPRYDTLGRRLRFATLLGRACRTATQVVCVSEFAAMSLDASTAVDRSRVTVIGEAASAVLAAPAPSVSAVPPDRPYVLYVGSLLRHKNVDTLVRAFAHDKLDVDLVLAGPVTDAQAVALRQLIAEVGADRVRHAGWLDDAALGAAYERASAVVVPSLHEGFGLPVLEAMQLGVPVVASDIPAFREIAGGHATLVDQPLDPAAWRDAIATLEFDDDRLAAARSWASKTTWAEVAGRFMLLFDEMLER